MRTLALGVACTHNIRWFKEEGGNISVDLTLFVLLCNSNFINKLKFNDIKKFKDCTNFLPSTESPHFPLGGKVGQLIKRKRVLC